MDGFFLQSLEPDGAPGTSDGIFVATGLVNPGVREGDIVEVNGRVREDSGQTILQLAALADVNVRSSAGEPVVEPVVYDPPAGQQEAELYKESLEGMLVTVNQPATVIGPTNRYGEYILVYDKWDTDNVRRSDGPVGFMMWVDDGTFNSHEDQSTLPVAVARGDKIYDVSGPLAYTFDNYKIAPVAKPDFTHVEKAVQALPERTGEQFSVATFNVENMFDAQVPHPDSPPRPSRTEYERDLHRVAEGIRAMGAPAIVALQEVENITILRELAQQPQLNNFQYEAVLLEGNDSRGIDSGYLVRQDQATIEAFAIEDAPGKLFSRPPLMLNATVHLDSSDRQVILLNNHFLSLSAGEVQTEPVRNGQAAWNASVVEKLRTSHPDAEFIVLGDLNSFYETKPLNTLQDSGLRHAYEFLGEDSEQPYTYVFEGATQTMDHILMSDSLFADLIDVSVLHINADYPLANPDDMSARRVSDHDPLVVTFSSSD
jgi:predicted extracellular nuclease